MPDPEKTKDTASFKPLEVAVGDSFFYSRGFAVLEKLETIKNIPGVEFSENDSAVLATIKVQAQSKSIYTLRPVLIHKSGGSYSQADTLIQENLTLQLENVSGDRAVLGIKESDSIMEYITLKAYKFPFINLLWLGTILMVIGMLISMFYRREKRRKVALVKTSTTEARLEEESMV